MAKCMRGRRAAATKVLGLALLASVSACSDDFARFNGGLTTASLGIEPSNQDRIIRKADGTSRAGVRPADVPEQSYPADTTETPLTRSEPATYVAPVVASDALPPLDAEPVTAEPVVPARSATRTVARVEEPPRHRAVTKPKLAAAGVPIIPPAPEAPGRLKRVGESLVTGSVGAASKPVTADPAPAKRVAVKRQKPKLTAADGAYTVVQGDTVYAIARRYGLSSQDLLDANGMTSSALRIGQQLQVPRAGARQVAVAVAPTIREPAAPRAKAETEKAQEIVTGSVAPVAEKVRAVAAKPEVKVAKTTATAGSSSFSWPVRGRILASFGARTPAGTNDGVDIAVAQGTPVRAAADGIVLYSGSELEKFGNLVLVRHDNGWVSAYANASENLVSRGDRVKRGQTIAKSGKSGNASQPQVHFELRRNSKPVDPERHFKG